MLRNNLQIKQGNQNIKQAGMSSAQPQAEAVSLKFSLVFVYIHNFQFMPWSLPSFEGAFHWRSSLFQAFLIFGLVP